MHPFKRYISTYTTIPDHDWIIIENCLTKKTVKKNVSVIKEGKICKSLYFLESGFLRFYLNKDGNDVTKFFTVPPYCFTSQKSFNNDLPAKESVETIEKSIIWEMSKKDATKLLELESWNSFIIKLIQEVQGYTENILEDIQNNTAEERYRRMLETNHIILQKAPLKHLASYFGIAPQSLSRIRKKVVSKE